MPCNQCKPENPCPPKCPKVIEQLRIAVKDYPNVTDGIFPRKKNDVEPRLPSDVISRAVRDKPERVIEAAHDREAPVDHVRAEELKDVEAKPIDFPIIQKPIITPPKKIADDIEKKIDLIEEKKLIKEPIIVQEEILPPTKKTDDRDKEKNDFVKEKALVQPTIVEKEIVLPERIDEAKIDFVEKELKELIQEPVIVRKETVTPTEKTVDRDEKIDLITKEKLDREPVVVQEEIVIATERISDRVDEKIEEKDSSIERVAMEPVKKIPIEKPEIIEDEIERAPITEIELEPSRELEKHLEPEEREEEESVVDGRTDYEQFIDEELQESLPAVIAREIPEEPRAVRREISRNAATLYERIDRERPVRPPSEREAVTAMPEERPVREEISARRALEDSTITERIISRKPAAAEDVCEETCPLFREQKERIMRKLKARQRVVDHYYLTKGFRYFEDVCTCSLACMVYTLSRDPFVKSIFASLALFAVGLKLCSELDAWEMPSRVS